MSDQGGDHRVDAADANNNPANHEISEEPERYPLTLGSFMFWLIVIGLGLLGTCVFVSIFLALTRGS